ncbi:polymorphic toxin type 28 domain-containing protein [Kitasatospora sp. MMS16-BH015]|uniref:polymorphic toxin type 28 domain-containing protein n=1 Tax=Kitasatospora sp. MMS16-BH015 TaxID=2018025 RepID=UPI000CF28161|nr:polymorphic toxin type 28 domain-containing protein [Kitasatospora sp. MMS16-BH015]
MPVTIAAATGPDYSRKWSPPNTPLPRTVSVKGHDVTPATPAKPAHEVPPTWQAPKSPSAPKHGHASVRLAAAPAAHPLAKGQQAEAGTELVASGLPVALAPLAGSAAGGQQVEVDVADQKAATAAGVPGVLVSLTPAAGSAGGPVRLGVDLGRDGTGFGADWASRAQLVTLPGCALTTPQAKGCLKQTPLASHYDRVNQKLVADVTIAPNTALAKSAPAAGALASTAASAGASAVPTTVVAAVSGTSSGAGTFSATPLNPSQAWTAGGSSGAFTYSYPVQLPASLGGGAPSVALSYDSSSVDGKTSSTNSQASWIGDGWDYSPGFVERSYKPCLKDGVAGSGDECWAGANLNLSLAGHSGELVPDDQSCQTNAPGTTEQSNCTWRIKGDDGTKVQFLTGATNGTWNGSYIKVTDIFGTVYYLGLNHLPDASGNPTTKGADSGSAWTVPVYSPNSGDPCYDSSKGQGSWCQSAWRWNLDYVVDPHGNLTTYTYTPEANYYARGGGQNNGTGTNTQYTRGGVLASIGYGQLLSDQLTANGTYNPAAKVTFTSGERCTATGTACDPGNRTLANAANWPDAPLDESCASTGTCTNYSPSYWSTLWLKSIATQVRSAGVYQTVDSYALSHSFVSVQNATENAQVPWLDSVQRTASDRQASATPVPLAPVTFTSMLLRNRVDGTNLVPARPDFNRPRIQLITTETGGTVAVDYWPPDCSRVSGPMPGSADSDVRSCFNVKWHPPTAKAEDPPIDDWFLKYPVRTVTTNGVTTGSVPIAKTYTYGPAAWHRDDSPLTQDADRTWDQFRGYASVIAVTGSGQDGVRSQSRTSYYQGMNGDITSTGTRSTQVAGPMSGAVTDSDWLTGQTLESDSYTQENGGIVAYSVDTFSGDHPTATHNRGSLPALVARYMATTSTVTSKSKKTDGTWLTDSKTSTTDAAHGNVVLTVLDSADGLPDICTRTAYAAGSDPQVQALPSQVLVASGANACTAPLTQANAVSWTNTYYDNLGYGKLGSAHDVTATVAADRFDAGGNPQFTTKLAGYDAYGRLTKSTDQNTVDPSHTGGAVVTTAYTQPQPGELPTGITVVTPAPDGAADVLTGRKTSTTLDSARALPLTVTDQNGRVTTEAYDALGRLTSVWAPGRDTKASASHTFSYAIPGVVNGKLVNPSVTSASLRANGSYATSIQIMDGLGQTVQTQSDPAISAYSGRMIADTVLDSQGRTVRANAAWYNGDARPSTTLYQTTTQQVPAQTYTVFDGLGRPVSTQFVAWGATLTTTTTAYPGADRTDVTPPSGATPTSTVVDARGRTSQLWQYRTATATGNASDADVTSYTYTPAGQLATQKDAAGNTWTHGYDLAGRELTATDPDTGTSTKTYDTAGRLATTTDAREQTLAYTYDLLGRTTGSYTGSVSTANQRTGFTYDTVLKGQPATSTRYDSGNTYTSEVTAYDTAYHPTTTKVTIPGSEVGQSGTPFTYTHISVFDPISGALTADDRSAIGDIPEETLTYAYDDYGLLRSYGVFNGATLDLSNDYDAYGRNIRTTVNPWGTQIVVTNTFDESTGRPVSQFVDKQTAATGAVQQVTYAYNPAGKLTGVRNIPDNVPANTDLQCYGYDYLGRLTTAWTDTGTLTMASRAAGVQGACTNSTPTSGAQAPKKTTVGGPAPYWQTFGYDLTGNRKTLVQHDPSGDTTKDTTVTQTFNTGPNTPITTPNADSGTGGPHALLSTSTQTGTGTAAVSTTQYDASGNTTLITDPAELTTLTWDPENRVESVDKRTQVSRTHYLYDAAGNQLIRRYHGKNTIFLGGDELVYDPNTSTKPTGTRYYQMPGGLSLVRQGGKSTFQISDLHGTGSLSLDATALTETRRLTDPFGNPRGTQPSTWAGDRGYVGGTKDDIAGYTNLGAREYDTSHGRFITPDLVLDVANPQQWNGYAYSNNDPVNDSDPSGLCPRDECGGYGQNPGMAVGTHGTDTDAKVDQRGDHPGLTLQQATMVSFLYAANASFNSDHVRNSSNTSDADFNRIATKYHAGQSTIDHAAIEVWAYGASEAETDYFYQNYCLFLECRTGWDSALGSQIGSQVSSPFGLSTSERTADAVAGTMAALAAREVGGGLVRAEEQGLSAEARAFSECNSFPADTQVLLADGQTKAIVDLQDSDRVLATDPLAGVTKAESIVARIIGHEDVEFTDLTLAASDSTLSAQVVTSTAHHPYWDGTTQRWTNADDVKSGDELRRPDGSTVMVSSVRNYHTAPQAAYNLTIGELHTYYVLAGTVPVLVHNSSCGIPTKTDRIAEHLTFRDLDAAKRELGGEVVARKSDGTPWDHVGEVRDAQAGLLNRMHQIKVQMSKAGVDDPIFPSLQAELSQASKLLDYSEKYVPRY